MKSHWNSLVKTHAFDRRVQSTQLSTGRRSHEDSERHQRTLRHYDKVETLDKDCEKMVNGTTSQTIQWYNGIGRKRHLSLQWVGSKLRCDMVHFHMDAVLKRTSESANLVHPKISDMLSTGIMATLFAKRSSETLLT